MTSRKPLRAPMPESGGVVNHMMESLRAGQVVASFIVRLVRDADIARLASTAGFDSLYVDLEHSTISQAECSAICTAAFEAGVTPLVRVPTVDDICQVLDGGALGIIAPHVGSVAEAQRVVEACKYPPIGRRSYATRLPHFRYGAVNAKSAQAELNRATAVVIQIESAEGLANVAALAAVPGVDVLLVGTNDLAGELDVSGDYDHPRIQEAYANVIGACRAEGKFAGIGGLASRPDLIAKFVAMGARYVSRGNDLSFLLDAMSQRAAESHGL